MKHKKVIIFFLLFALIGITGKLTGKKNSRIRVFASTGVSFPVYPGGFAGDQINGDSQEKVPREVREVNAVLNVNGCRLKGKFPIRTGEIRFRFENLNSFYRSSGFYCTPFERIQPMPQVNRSIMVGTNNTTARFNTKKRGFEYTLVIPDKIS